MQVTRDLSRRMIEAIEQVPIIDVYERLVPEGRRVAQRVDFIAWLVACLGTELGSLGLTAEQIALLRDVEGPPEERWSLLSQYWPLVRTTNGGRMVLRVAWELYGAENVDDRTWKDISAQLWKESDHGFYHRLLRERANVHRVLVDGAVDKDQLSCCAPIAGVDRYLSVNCRPELESWAGDAERSDVLTVELLDVLLENTMERYIAEGCVGFRLGTLFDVNMPSSEQVIWAFGRVSRCEDDTAPPEPDLQSYLGHRLLDMIGEDGPALQVHVGDEAEVARLGALARQYPQVRFVGALTGSAHPFSLAMLARALPNVSLALVGVWRYDPQLARQALREWLYSVPLSKMLALGGGMAMVEMVAVQAMAAREHLAVLLAEMVAAGDLDEEDALLAMDRLLYLNAVECYGLQVD